MADDTELDAMEGAKTGSKGLVGADKGIGSPRKLDAKTAQASAKEAEGALPRLREAASTAEAEPAITVDEAGNAFHKGFKIPGNFSKLIDIFSELGDKAKGVAGDVVDGAKGLLRSPDKVISTGNAAMGRGAPSVVRAGAGELGAAALSAPAAAFLATMSPAATNEGEKDPGYRDMRQPVMTGDNLDNQTQGAMDPGINATAKPTMQPQGAAADPRPKTDIGSAMPKAATMVDNVTGKTGQQTGGGFYPTFDKNSVEASDFRTAFAKARSSGLQEFSWQGRRYNTKLDTDKTPQASPGTTPTP